MRRRKDHTLSRILSLVTPYRAGIAVSLLSAAAYVLLSLLAPVLSGQAVDEMVGIGQVNFDKIGRITVFFGITVVLSSVCQWIMTYVTNYIAYKTDRKLRTDIFEKITNLRVAYIDAHPHGDIINRAVTDVEMLSDGLLLGFSQLFTGILTILATIGFMLSINIAISAVVIVMTPLSLFVASFIAKYSYKLFKEQSELRGKMTALAEEAIGGAKTVKQFGMTAHFGEKIAETGEELRVVGVKALFISALTNPSTRFVNNAVYAAVGIIGALFAINGKITVGQLVCFLTYANQYTKPFNEISGVIAEFVGAKASAERIFELLDEEKTEDHTEKLPVPAECPVAFDHVSFSYLPEKPLIENLCLDIRDGTMTAIVGPTGCGKTTLINLLMRFYDVTDGNIRLGNTPVNDITLDEMRSSFGMVLQDTWLKKGTVADNIAYGKRGATKDEIRKAAREAFADSFIESLPNGYDTVISEDGGNLSQGQKQLLCISRIMLSLPPMIILDEATSSIDTMTEQRIRAAFDRLTRGRTSFVVAHRLSTIVKADRILVMKDGRIIEQGTHEELLAKNGFYRNLYESQFEPT